MLYIYILNSSTSYTKLMFTNTHRSRRYDSKRSYTIAANTIYENFHPVYQIRRGFWFAGVSGTQLEDQFGTPLITIEKDFRVFTASIYRLLSNDGRELANIKKPFSLFRAEINTIYGRFTLKNLSIPSDGMFILVNGNNQMVAKCARGVVEIPGNQNQALILAMIIVIRFLTPAPPNNSYGGVR